MEYDLVGGVINGTLRIFRINSQCLDLEIPVADFWSWVCEKNLNEACRDFYDPCEPDGHGQQLFTLTQEEYFDLGIVINKDIIKYIQEKNLVDLTLF